MKINVTQDLLHYGAPLEEAGLAVYSVHGRGQTPAFMTQIADRINLPEVAWLLPAAHSHSWYPESFLAPIRENQPALDDALATVRTQLSAVLGQGGPPVVVFGFSQGACLLSEYLLQDRPSLSGAVLHTGGYLGPSEREWAVSPQGEVANLTVKMFTARDDPWVPLHRVEATRSAFRSLGAAVELTVYDGSDHQVNDDAVRLLRRYLSSRTVSPTRH